MRWYLSPPLVLPSNGDSDNVVFPANFNNLITGSRKSQFSHLLAGSTHTPAPYRMGEMHPTIAPPYQKEFFIL